MCVASCIIMVAYDNGAVDVVKIYPDRLLQPQSSRKAQANILINMVCKINCILYHFSIDIMFWYAMFVSRGQ